MNSRITVVVQGRVQGVAFRKHTRNRAKELGVRGWVCNLPTGEVHGVFEGEAGAVASLLEWCRSGPPSARVDRLDTATGAWTGEFTDFVIRY